MTTHMDNPVDGAKATVDAMNQQQSSGDVASIARNEIAAAHDSFKGRPQDYRNYISTLKTDLAQGNHDAWLHEVEIFDSAATANDTIAGKTQYDGTPIKQSEDASILKALSGTGNSDELYKLLDNYSAKKKNDTSADAADGKIGSSDIAAFLSDADSDQNSAAAQYVAKHAEAKPAVQDMMKRLGLAEGLISRTDLLNEMGYTGNDAEANFAKDSAGAGAVRTFGADGRPDALVTKDGISRGFHYDANGNIDAINKTNADGSNKQYRKNENGEWVDEHGKPGGFAKPSFDAQGNYSYYTHDGNDPNGLVRTSIDTTSGDVQSTRVPAVDANGRSVLEESPAAADLSVGAKGKIGDLDVVGATGAPGTAGQPNHAEYAIADGDTLTGISRRILGVKGGAADPNNLPEVIKGLAAANDIKDPNLILAGTQLKVPADIASVVASQQGAQPQAGPEAAIGQPQPGLDQQGVTGEQQGLPNSSYPDLAAPFPGAQPPMDMSGSPLAPVDMPQSAPDTVPGVGAPQMGTNPAPALDVPQMGPNSAPPLDVPQMGPNPVPGGQPQTWQQMMLPPGMPSPDADSTPKR